jgi:hypothetical protein
MTYVQDYPGPGSPAELSFRINALEWAAGQIAMDTGDPNPELIFNLYPGPEDGAMLGFALARLKWVVGQLAVRTGDSNPVLLLMSYPGEDPGGIAFPLAQIEWALGQLQARGGGVNMDPLPSALDGSIGNTATYPHYIRMKGPHADKFAIGPVLSNGDQVVRIYEAATATLLETQLIRAGGVEDDHNTVALCCHDDGTLIAAASGHNSVPNTNVMTRSPAGVWSNDGVTWSDITTYPCLFIASNGVTWWFIRLGNLDWSCRRKTTPASAWSDEVTYMTSVNQSYTTPRQLGDTIIFSCRFNNSDPAAGPIRLIDFNMLTEEFHDVNGGLGFRNGTPSGNGKTLPVALLDIPIFLTNEAGRVVNLSDADLNHLLIVDDTTADTYDTRLFAWRYNGTGNRLDPASYAQGPVFMNMRGRMSAASRYTLNGKLAQETHTGFRAYITRGVAGRMFFFDQWDADDVTDLSTFKVKNLIRNAPGAAFLARGLAAIDATETMPVVISNYTSFTDFDNYGTANVIFAEPWRGPAWPVIEPGYTMRPETQAYLARCPVQPNEYWAKFIVDPFIDALIDADAWTNLDALYLLCSWDKFASLLNVRQAAFDPTQADGLPDSAFHYGIGWTGDGVGHLDTNFNPSTAPGKVYTQNSAHVQGMFVGPPTLRFQADVSTSDVDEFGNANTRVRIRSVAATVPIQINATSTSGGAQNNTTQAAQAFVSSRSASTGYNNNIGGSTAGFAQTSSAPTNANFWLLGRNGQVAKSTRTIAGWGFGNDIDATKRPLVVAAWADFQNRVLEYLGPQV